ncbi:MAG: alkaline phosphatase D family protein [Myxococcales bacterium]|nr:alkaline phosphatase D family protein [Myxococcales bacterium]MCB9519734.1 alkaline phosphatase D family protein [Myxococcales bacterium]MCB9530425.1 alkaline phosphatase D family protein [Myxococcales bacterium]MCB9533672.1 alkaline phosphatase D family protein [Myxococcales bacterium]
MLQRRPALRSWLALPVVALISACGDDAGTSSSGSDLDVRDDVTADAGDGADVTAEVDVVDEADDDIGSDTPDASDVATPDATGEDTSGADVVDTDGVDDTAPDGDAGEIDASDSTADDTSPLPFDPATVAEDARMFPLGVQSGAARDTSALIWSLITDSFDKRLIVWADGGAIAVDRRVTPGSTGYTHVPIDGLAAGTWYSYAFFDGPSDAPTARSPIGRFRSALAPGSLEPITIGSTTCTKRDTQPWEALEVTAGLGIDLVVHVGDMSYNDGAVTLDEYRSEWRATLADPGYLALYQAASLIATWDDHEVADNWDPETLNAAQVRTARAAWNETLAIEGSTADPIWRSYQWGDTVEFFVLDCRSERLPSTRRGDDAQYISPAQLDWLQRGLLDSTAHFKVVLSSVPITNMPFLWDVAQEDRWEGYAAQRTRLLEFITGNAIPNVWFLGGDFHIGFVGRVEPDGPASSMWEIAVGPGGNGPNPLSLTLTGDQFPFHTPDFGREFATTLVFDPARDAVRVRFYDTEGAVLFDRWLEQ